MTEVVATEQKPKEHAGSGLGRGKAPCGTGRRHMKSRVVLRDNIQGVTKPAIRRMARRGGVKRIDASIYDETRAVLKLFVQRVIRDTVTYTEHARRKTVMAIDVMHALKHQGRALYVIQMIDPCAGRDIKQQRTHATPSKAAAEQPKTQPVVAVMQANA